ncbi:MAG: hypothetical protein J2P31_17785, partial [Blastocatellia bacterium]|nr:hypothetical protein [Blastocatellia bacterium]
QNALSTVARQKFAEEPATSRILRREQHLRKTLRSHFPQIIKPFFIDQVESPFFGFEFAFRELVFPLNKYGITPEFVSSNDIDPSAVSHLAIFIDVLMITVRLLPVH